MTGHHVSAQLDRSQALDRRVLEAISDGVPLADVLALIARGLEDLVQGWRVSLLLVSSDGTTLRHGAAPSLPDAYVRDIDGRRAGPAAGSCGTAAYRRSTVIVEDIATDPLWDEYRHFALPHGLRACWSVPVVDRDGTVLATFAVYHARPARPEPEHLALIHGFVHLARVAIHHDRAQREVRTSEERFRTVFRDAAFGLAVMDLSGRLRHTNLAFQRMVGYTDDELRGTTIAELTHPKDRAKSLELARDLLEGRRDSFRCQQRCVAKDGRVIWARLTVSARRDAEGRVVDTIAVAEDITRERAGEHTRRQQQMLLQMASRLGRFGAWSFDVRSGAVHLSDQLREIHEIELDAPIDGAALFAGYAPEHQPTLRAAMTSCVEHGVPFDLEAGLTTARGNARWVRVIGEAVRDGHGAITRVRGTLQDITDWKLLEQQSLRSQRLESIGTLAGGIAHDLNNVLTPIAMGVNLLKGTEHDPGRLQLLDVIQQSAARAASMVQQVLSFARGVESRRSRVAPARLVSDIAALLGDTLPKQIRLEIDVDAQARLVDVDQTQIHQVLLNLCVNARDAMPDGGTLRIAVRNVSRDMDTVPSAAPPHFVSIVVEDTGEGIAPEVLDKIFDPFFTTKPTGLGTGLGLSTSLGIVRSHGGRIDVASTPGRGTRFEVLLPAASAAARDPEPPRTEPEAAGGQGTVLLADDEAAVRLVTRQVLQRAGYRVLEAANGVEALRVFADNQEQIAVVLTDMMMPGMDPGSLIRALRALSPTVPIIGMSGIGASERLSQPEVAGLVGFLQKPYAPDALRRLVHSALHGASR